MTKTEKTKNLLTFTHNIADHSLRAVWRQVQTPYCTAFGHRALPTKNLLQA